MTPAKLPTSSTSSATSSFSASAIPDYNQQGLRIYTSLDPQLQQIAQDAVADGLKKVDEIVRARHERLARIAAKRGEDRFLRRLIRRSLWSLSIRTPARFWPLVGGRNYGISQLDHAVRDRPTGSIFKPFVYAAAFNTALAGTPLTNTDGTSAVFTPVTMLHDAQTTFTFENQTYSPARLRRQILRRHPRH